MRPLRRSLPLLLVTFALLPLPLAAQGGGRLTVLAGAAISRLSGADVEGDEGLGSRTGLHVGISSDIALFGGTLSFSPGGHYIDKGFSDVVSETFSSSVKLTYLEIQAPLKVTLPLGGRVDLSAFAGPGFGLSMGCLAKTIDEDVERSVDCVNSDFGVRGTDITGIAGTALSIGLTPDVRVVLQGALDMSLRSINSMDGGQSLKHRTWLIGAGINYPLERR